MAFTVILEKNVHEDTAKEIEAAIKALRYVLSVKPHVADNLALSVAYDRIRADILPKLYDVVYPERNKT